MSHSHTINILRMRSLFAAVELDLRKCSKRIFSVALLKPRSCLWCSSCSPHKSCTLYLPVLHLNLRFTSARLLFTSWIRNGYRGMLLRLLFSVLTGRNGVILMYFKNFTMFLLKKDKKKIFSMFLTIATNYLVYIESSFFFKIFSLLKSNNYCHIKIMLNKGKAFQVSFHCYFIISLCHAHGYESSKSTHFFIFYSPSPLLFFFVSFSLSLSRCFSLHRETHIFCVYCERSLTFNAHTKHTEKLNRNEKRSRRVKTLLLFSKLCPNV